MPTYKYEFIVNGVVDYTCSDRGSRNFYAFNLDLLGIDYKLIRTALV